MIETLRAMLEIIISLDQIFLIIIIFKEKHRRNNHNASKLYEKYNNLAREALSSGDKIMSKIIFNTQIIFKRIINEQESLKKARSNDTNDKEIETADSVDKNEKSIIEKIQHNKLINSGIFSDFKTSNLIFTVSNNFLYSPFKIFPDGN